MEALQRHRKIFFGGDKFRQSRGFAVSPNAIRLSTRYLPGSRLDGFAQVLMLRTACEFFKSDDLLAYCRQLSKGA